MPLPQSEAASKAIERLDLPANVSEILSAIHAEVASAHRDALIEMTQAIRQQASAIDRIQKTLLVLVEHVAPTLEKSGRVPVAFSSSTDSRSADLAKAVVIADPIAAGFTLSQADLARALGVNQGYVSMLVKAFDLSNDGDCAVVVRRGARNTTVNYSPQAVGRFLQLVASPPPKLSKAALSAIRAVKLKMQANSIPKDAAPSATSSDS